MQEPIQQLAGTEMDLVDLLLLYLYYCSWDISESSNKIMHNPSCEEFIN